MRLDRADSRAQVLVGFALGIHPWGAVLPSLITVFLEVSLLLSVEVLEARVGVGPVGPAVSVAGV